MNISRAWGKPALRHKANSWENYTCALNPATFSNNTHPVCSSSNSSEKCVRRTKIKPLRARRGGCANLARPRHSARATVVLCPGGSGRTPWKDSPVALWSPGRLWLSAVPHLRRERLYQPGRCPLKSLSHVSTYRRRSTPRASARLSSSTSALLSAPPSSST